MYYSQIGQDQYYIENIAKHRKNGFFLDIGAYDGLDGSNTATLEFQYNWNGICIEANPFLLDTLKKNRPNSKIISCAAWYENSIMELEIPLSDLDGIPGAQLSRLSNINRNENYFKNHFSAKVVRPAVSCRTITSILGKDPPVIDYMSLDVEGAEIEVLKGIDFSNIDIRFMSIEHGDRPGYLDTFKEFLEPYGYKIHRVNRWDVEFEK